MPKKTAPTGGLHIAARRHLGVPFRHLGRGPDFLDCVGLAKVSAVELGWSVVDRTDYPRVPRDGQLEQMLEENLGPPVAREPVQLADLRAGDLVSIHFDGERVRRGLRSKWPVRHVGIVGEFDGRLTLIHTDSHIGRVVEQSIDETIRNRIAAVYRRNR